ncbi:MAG: RcpC/CpaB family pilus assembly protein, partial [Propionibacteriaceae bacterium]
SAGMTPAPLRSLARIVTRHRRLTATLMAGLSLFCVVMALQPHPAATTAVVVAVRDVPGGTVLTESDVEIRQLPSSAVPSTALRTMSEAVGKLVTTALPRNSILHGASIVSHSWGSVTQGHVIVPVKLGDADVAALLSPGDIIDVLATGESSARVLAQDARVLAIPAKKSGSGFGTTSSDAVLIIIATTAEGAQALAQAHSADRISVVVKIS